MVRLSCFCCIGFVAISALCKYYYIYWNEARVVGIGIISNASGFRILPFLLLPRLRPALTALYTAGCAFEGDQMPLSEAWFIIYPGIAETLLFLFGTINLFAKLLRRRVSDVLFGPTLIFFCALHLLRQSLENSKWLGFDGRIPMVISASEYEQLTLKDFFTSDILFWLKLVVLGINFVPLLLSYSTSTASPSNRRRPPSSPEQVIDIRPWTSGELGRPPILCRSKSLRMTLCGTATSCIMISYLFPSSTGACYSFRHCFVSLLVRCRSQVLVFPMSAVEKANGMEYAVRSGGHQARFVSTHDPLILAGRTLDVSTAVLH